MQSSFDGTFLLCASRISPLLLHRFSTVFRSKEASNQGGGLLSPNVATNAAIFLVSSMRRDALPVISICICLFTFGCGSRI